MAAKLISLSFKPSTELPKLADLKTFLETDFGRQVAGFAPLETDAQWGDCTVDLLGKDAEGSLVAVFPSVSLQERDFHDMISQGMLLSTWLEENKDQIAKQYGAKGADAERPLRLVLVAPAAMGTSRALSRALERAGFEIMPYSIFEIETSDGPLKAVSFDTKGAPAGAGAVPAPAAPRAAAPAAKPAAPSAAAPPAPAPVEEAPAPAPPPPPAPEPAAEVKPPSAVEIFVSGLSDQNIKAMSEQILTFLTSRFPAATGVVNGQQGFTLNVGKEHLATIRLDKQALWLEVGPERIPTNKIRDPATLDRAMNLPSVLEALQSVHS